jgi:hypothetical protein
MQLGALHGRSRINASPNGHAARRSDAALAASGFYNTVVTWPGMEFGMPDHLFEQAAWDALMN